MHEYAASRGFRAIRRLGGYTPILQDAFGQLQETHSISAGRDYSRVGPEHQDPTTRLTFLEASVPSRDSVTGCPCTQRAHHGRHSIRVAQSISGRRTGRPADDGDVATTLRRRRRRTLRAQRFGARRIDSFGRSMDLRGLRRAFGTAIHAMLALRRGTRQRGLLVAWILYTDLGPDATPMHRLCQHRRHRGERCLRSDETLGSILFFKSLGYARRTNTDAEYREF